MVADVLRDNGLSLRKALRLSGCSRSGYYHQAKKRLIPSDPYIVEKTKQIALQRPLYGRWVGGITIYCMYHILLYRYVRSSDTR